MATIWIPYPIEKKREMDVNQLYYGNPKMDGQHATEHAHREKDKNHEDTIHPKDGITKEIPHVIGQGQTPHGTRRGS